jgi:hypothetical protein
MVVLPLTHSTYNQSRKYTSIHNHFKTLLIIYISISQYCIQEYPRVFLNLPKYLVSRKLFCTISSEDILLDLAYRDNGVSWNYLEFINKVLEFVSYN